METKICDSCDQEIASTETVCPRCKLDFEESEQEVGVVSRAMTIIEKRKAREKAAADKAAADEAEKNPPKRKSLFSSLAKGVKK